MIRAGLFDRCIEGVNAHWLSEGESAELVAAWPDAAAYRFQSLYFQDRSWTFGDGLITLHDQAQRCWTLSRQLKPIKIDPRGGNMVAQVAPTILVASIRIPIDAWFESSDQSMSDRLYYAAGLAIKRLDEDLVVGESTLLEAALGQSRDAIGHFLVDCGYRRCMGWRSTRMLPRFRTRGESDGIYLDAVMSVAFVLEQNLADEWWSTGPQNS